MKKMQVLALLAVCLSVPCVNYGFATEAEEEQVAAGGPAVKALVPLIPSADEDHARLTAQTAFSPLDVKPWLAEWVTSLYASLEADSNAQSDFDATLAVIRRPGYPAHVYTKALADLGKKMNSASFEAVSVEIKAQIRLFLAEVKTAIKELEIIRKTALQNFRESKNMFAPQEIERQTNMARLRRIQLVNKSLKWGIPAAVALAVVLAAPSAMGLSGN